VAAGQAPRYSDFSSITAPLASGYVLSKTAAAGANPAATAAPAQERAGPAAALQAALGAPRVQAAGGTAGR
jgi:hypothetical protein